MKLNGALKPRQGASKQGSSPGVVLKEYRVKRYFKVNKNVVKGVPLNACGVQNKKSFNDDNIIYSCNYICNNNQQQKQKQQTTTPLELKGKCGKTFSRCINSSSSLSRLNFSTSIKTKTPINFKTQNTTRSRVSAVTKSKEEETLAVITSIQVDSQQGTGTNVLTRQAKNIKLAREKSKNKEKNITSVERIMKQVNQNTSHNTTNNKEVNKFFFVPKINVIPNLRAIILRLFIQLKLLLFSMFSHAIKHLSGTPFNHSAEGGEVSTSFSSITLLKGCCLHCRLVGYNLAKMMRACLFQSICLKNARRDKPAIALYLVIYAATAILLPHAVIGDDGDTFFPINGIETTTPEFDYASRGQKKFGDKCENTLECGFPGSICDAKKKSCQCTEDLPVTNHIDKCGKEAAVNESCFFNEQCEVKYFQTECRDQRCVCRFDMTPVWLKDGSVECKGRGDKKGPETYVDPAMIGVLIGMALMFIIICVVLRLFSQARWRENRTIFNTPNPRLMNVSLLRESKLLHGQERRGSRMSVRAPSRQPSMASLRPHSPNPSLGKTGSRSNSHGSNASATSLRSTRSNCVSPAGIANNSHHERKGSTYQPHQHHHPQQQKLQPLQQEEEQKLTQTNIISNPVAETVTVEIIEPEKFIKANE